MLKYEHFVTVDGGDKFSHLKYLFSYNPGKSISHYSTSTNYMTKEDLLELMKPIIEFKHLIYSTYESLDNTATLEITNIYNQSTEQMEVYRIEIRYSEGFDIKKFEDKLEPLIKPKGAKKGSKYSLITISRNEPQTLVKYSNKEVSIDKENSYNLNCSLDDLITDITSDKSGLIIMSSKPGAGKTSLIKYLAQEIKGKNFFFLSNSNLDILSNPSFTTYCLDNLQNAVLVLEDCEKALISRDINKGYDISNILNITDGIMGDLLNLKIVATLNTTDRLDQALLRKGRLIRSVEFKSLKIEQVINLSKTLGKDIKDPKEMMLCEVYNSEDNGSELPKSIKIGF